MEKEQHYKDNREMKETRKRRKEKERAENEKDYIGRRKRKIQQMIKITENMRKQIQRKCTKIELQLKRNNWHEIRESKEQRCKKEAGHDISRGQKKMMKEWEKTEKRSRSCQKVSKLAKSK